jgi:hypothetical protein
MTGIAAQLCGNPDKVRELGYKVSSDGKVFEDEDQAEDETGNERLAEIGRRNALLNDLCPAATFICYS